MPGEYTNGGVPFPDDLSSWFLLSTLTFTQTGQCTRAIVKSDSLLDESTGLCVRAPVREVLAAVLGDVAGSPPPGVLGLAQRLARLQHTVSVEDAQFISQYYSPVSHPLLPPGSAAPMLILNSHGAFTCGKYHLSFVHCINYVYSYFLFP